MMNLYQQVLAEMDTIDVTENVAIPPKNAKEKEERRSARRQTATLGSERFRRPHQVTTERSLKM